VGTPVSCAAPANLCNKNTGVCETNNLLDWAILSQLVDLRASRSWRFRGDSSDGTENVNLEHIAILTTSGRQVWLVLPSTRILW